MKITLNDSVPQAKRAGVETLVKSLVKAPQILWMPSRFPRYVMLIEPGPDDKAEPQSGSIFESPNSGTKSLAAVTNFLEDRIKLHLAGS